MLDIEETRIAARGLEFRALSAGQGPLVLLLHGFPDHAPSWRPLLGALAGRGFRAVSPWMRGYSPEAIPANRSYHAANLGMDVLAFIDALGYRSAAVVGHDWGALAAYTAALADPSRIDRLVTLAVPYGTFGKALLSNGDQQRRSWYMYFFATPMALPAFRHRDYDFVDRLWQDWSPHIDPRHAKQVKDTLRLPGVDEAALSYYRQLYRPDELDADLRPLQTKVGSSPVAVPTLYLHGADDGCIGVECVQGMEAFFPKGFDCQIVPRTGHFLHLERPDDVHSRIIRFLRLDLENLARTDSPQAPSAQ